MHIVIAKSFGDVCPLGTSASCLPSNTSNSNQIKSGMIEYDYNYD